jgi:GcrA cell cycle regulator
MRADYWSKERIATLKQLWAQGQPASAIAKTLGGISRGAVLGKIFRLRLGAAEKPPKKPAKNAGQRKSAQEKSRQASPQDRPSRRRGVVPNDTAPHVPRRKSLFELTNQCCRWPHGEPGAKNFFFCGAAGADVENGLPYCPKHMRRAYIVPPEPGATGLAKSFSAASLRAASVTPWRVVSKMRSKAAA